MEVKQDDNTKKGRFFFETEGKTSAEMTYIWAGPDKIIIDHTDVSEALKGKNAGKQLVHEAVLFAREKHIKILPLCPFARHVFDSVSDYHDVLV